MDAENCADTVARALSWEEAHKPTEATVLNLPPELRGRPAAGIGKSVWQLLVHIQVAQHDLLEFCRNPQYSHDLIWPDDYWPHDPEPPDDAAWNATVDAIVRDREELAAFARVNAARLSEPIAWGTGQTYLRTVLVAMDHTAYHTAQIVAVRRVLGAWSD
jgi:uncharacterized damage-inducible protein DinB